MNVTKKEGRNLREARLNKRKKKEGEKGQEVRKK